MNSQDLCHANNRNARCIELTWHLWKDSPNMSQNIFPNSFRLFLPLFLVRRVCLNPLMGYHPSLPTWVLMDSLVNRCPTTCCPWVLVWSRKGHLLQGQSLLLEKQVKAGLDTWRFPAGLSLKRRLGPHHLLKYLAMVSDIGWMVKSSDLTWLLGLWTPCCWLLFPFVCPNQKQFLEHWLVELGSQIE